MERSGIAEGDAERQRSALYSGRGSTTLPRSGRPQRSLHDVREEVGPGGGGECLEVATCPHTIHIRDSKHPTGPHLTLSSPA
ncbi:DUF397 domain-containing protein [Streptomyces sp. T028]|uniref:DUF397 domain-containing protein n=1 Tax=Streptomyces sp. T028 TaxID=3394379 RepID=UPI003A843216